MRSERDRKLQALQKQYDARLNGDSYKNDKKDLELQNFKASKALDARQRADRDKLHGLYRKLISSASGDGPCLDIRKIEEEIQRIKDYYKQFIQTSSTPSPLQGSVDQRPALRPTPATISSTSATEALRTSTVRADGSSHAAQSLPSANPAEDQQRQQHVGRLASSDIPVSMPVSSQRGHAVQPGTGHGLPHSQRPAAMSTAPMQPSNVQPVPGEGLPHSQRPAVMSTAPMQPSSLQARGQLQSSNTPVHLSPTPTVLRGAPAVSRSLSTPAMAPPSVGNMARPSAPASVAPLVRV